MKALPHSALLLLLAACDDWAATAKAGNRRLAEARLESCIRQGRCSDSSRCYDEIQGWCLDAGMERTCGEGGATPSCTP